jgi:hypothetical protein
MGYNSLGSRYLRLLKYGVERPKIQQLNQIWAVLAPQEESYGYYPKRPLSQNVRRSARAAGI